MPSTFAPHAFDDAVIGVVGGMGPAATGQFLVHLAEELTAEHDQDHPRVIVLSDTKVPDRTTAIARGDPGPADVLRVDLHRAIDLGASVLAVPCNTAHYFLTRLVQGLPVPLVNIVEATLAEARRRSPEGVWLTGTAGTLASGLYQTAAARTGYRVHVPGPTEVDLTMQVICDVKAGRVSRAGATWGALAAALQAVHDVPLMTACTELPLAFAASELREEAQVSSLRALAVATLRAAAGTTGWWPVPTTGQPVPVAVGAS